MSISLDRMRWLVRNGMGLLKDPNIIDEDVDELLNMALWDLEDLFDFKSKETLLASALVEGQAEYSVSDSDLGVTLDCIKSVCVIDEDDRRHKLKRMTRNWLDVNGSTNEDDRGFPTRWLRENTTLILDPIPGEDEDDLALEISIDISVASLVEGTNDTTGLPRNWDGLVVQGAISKGKILYGGNLEDGIVRHNFVQNQAKEIKSKNEKEAPDRYAGLQVLWDFPENNED